MTDWNRHNWTRYLKLAAKEGITLQEAPPPQRKMPRWSICIENIYDDKIYVSVRLPRWLSVVWLWWKLPKAARAGLRRG